MSFDPGQAIRVLERTPGVLRALLADLDDEWIHADEGSGTWSPFDVVGHLIHGDRTDWIPRAPKPLIQALATTAAWDQARRAPTCAGSAA